ncbi:MAG TPA: UDP-glucose/GDP-mannose dehydrogenase family protein [Syntrophaceae bacterium]|nr:UDP-glucose/GDP-mannose dehydrogenase family protein [Syntrophaceae bacterium]
MKLCVVGPGYVGLVTASCFAEMGNDVICVGKSDERIEGLKKGIIPIYEPGLDVILKRNYQEGRLKFTANLEEGVAESLIIFIAVPTPPDRQGSADLAHVLSVAQDIGACMEEYKIIVDKSTVPVGTAEKVRDVIQSELDRRKRNIEFDVVANPEFLKQGDAISDFMKPDRIVVGTDNVRTAEIMRALYAPFARTRDKVIVMDVRSAEMTKYAANAMLATKISFMNEIANICEHVGADVGMVRKGIGSDHRIGYHFIYPGVGYGGSCFPKDLKALIATAKECGYSAQLMQAVEDVNERQKRLLAHRIIDYFKDKGGLHDKIIGIWGLSFKPNTDDMREAPSRIIIGLLTSEGVKVHAFDPMAIGQAKQIFADNPYITFFDNAYDTLKGADALALITEWNLFRNPDFDRIKSLLKRPVIFDGRNQYDPKELKERGFEYFGIGR